MPAAGPTAPVFVLAGGRRTGSTLVQRLLISSGKILIWGEHDGVLVRQLYQLAFGMQQWLKSGVGALRQLQDFRQQGYNCWIPNMCPPLNHFEDGCRALLEQSLGVPARAMGYERWGFKEVRYGAGAAKFLQALYPDAGFVLLVRDPRSCLLSIRAAQWGERVALQDGPLPFLKEWTRLSGELADVQPQLRRAVLVRYEDVLARSAQALEGIAKVARIPLEEIRVADVLAYREGGPKKRTKVELDAQDEEALRHPDVMRVAARFRYGAPEAGEGK